MSTTATTAPAPDRLKAALAMGNLGFVAQLDNSGESVEACKTKIAAYGPQRELRSAGLQGIRQILLANK